MRKDTAVMNDGKIRNHVERVRTEGYTILKAHFSKDLITSIAEAFHPIYEANLDTIRTNPNRGPMRHYLRLPLAEPFYQSSIHADPGVINVVKGLLGEDAEFAQYATDTPANGSDFQEWHSDVQPLFPEAPEYCPPPAVLTVNFSFVDIGPHNGPVEVAAGTHLMPFDEALPKIESGAISHKPLFMNVGDVLIRDPRCVHRGTPNRTDTPRPVAVITFERSWCWSISRFHANTMSRSLYSSLSDIEQKLLRRVVEPELTD
jgi:hypothetical protein